MRKTLMRGLRYRAALTSCNVTDAPVCANSWSRLQAWRAALPRLRCLCRNQHPVPRSLRLRLEGDRLTPDCLVGVPPFSVQSLKERNRPTAIRGFCCGPAGNPLPPGRGTSNHHIWTASSCTLLAQERSKALLIRMTIDAALKRRQP
jgi:hypothetical protein